MNSDHLLVRGQVIKFDNLTILTKRHLFEIPAERVDVHIFMLNSDSVASDMDILKPGRA